MADVDVRKMADWLTQAQERIMEWLRDGGSHPSSAIAESLNSINEGVSYSRPHISRSCGMLAEYGLLDKNYQNYSLNESGERYLDGELDASSLETGDGNDSDESEIK